VLNRIAAAVIAAFFATGCALVWTKDDSTELKAKKLTARIPLALVTLGISEVVIDREYARQQRFDLEKAREKQRAQLVLEMKKWENAAVATTNPGDRELYLRFYDSKRQEIADLDAKMAAAVGAK
jgi:hypothetical protein